MSKQKRIGKIYVDYLRNQRGSTFVAPYSTRARPGAPVSMPIDWHQLSEVKSADAFTLRSVLASRKSKKIAWSDFLSVRQQITKSIWRQLE
jgi:bifunctional non-homologous end joining protein LigD